MQDHEAGGTPPPQTPEKPATKKTRPPSKYPLPSERVPFSRHFDVLDRFVTASRNGRDAVSAVTVEGGTLPMQSAQLTTGFLTDLGLLVEEGHAKFKPSPEAIQFLMTRTANEDRAKPILRALVEKTWFAETAKDKVARNIAVPEDELLADLAIATQTHGERKAGALKILLEYLVYTGILFRTERGLVLGAPPPAASAIAPTPPVVTLPGWTQTQPGPIGAVIQEAGVVPMTPRGGTAVSFRFGVGTAPPQIGMEWKTIQTDDFYVRVRPSVEVIEDLRDHLALLERKLKPTKAETSEVRE